MLPAYYLLLLMPRSRSVTSITCQNPACRFFLIEEGKDLTKNGKNSAGNQQYFCHHCQTYFVETKNTPYYHSRLDRSEVERICRHAPEKISMRGVARVTGHHRDTISATIVCSESMPSGSPTTFCTRSLPGGSNWTNSGHLFKTSTAWV